MLIGRYDLNNEFYRLQSAGLFLNNSFGIGPEFSLSGREGPSIFPYTAVGARFGIKPVEEIVLRAAVLDGVPVERPDGAQEIFAKGDGLLVVAEAAYLYRPRAAEQPHAHANSASAEGAAALTQASSLSVPGTTRQRSKT